MLLAADAYYADDHYHVTRDDPLPTIHLLAVTTLPNVTSTAYPGPLTLLVQRQCSAVECSWATPRLVLYPHLASIPCLFIVNFITPKIITVKRHFYVDENFIQIHQNEPFDKFLRSSILYIVVYGAVKKIYAVLYKFM